MPEKKTADNNNKKSSIPTPEVASLANDSAKDSAVVPNALNNAVTSKETTIAPQYLTMLTDLLKSNTVTRDMAPKEHLFWNTQPVPLKGS